MLTLKALHALCEKNRPQLEKAPDTFQLRGHSTDHPWIMGVINLSADSWYRESVCLSHEAAIRRADVLRAQGAQVVDLGAESTLPHAARVSEAEQMERLAPLIHRIHDLGVLVSIETYHASVARIALEAGASIINMTGSLEAQEIYRLAAQHDAAVIHCYVHGEHVRQVDDLHPEIAFIERAKTSFKEAISKAKAAGLERLWLDPGMGFYYRDLQDGKTRVRFQIQTFLQCMEFSSLGKPVCNALPHAFEQFGEEVRCAESFFAVLASLGQTQLFRTHEVARVAPVLELMGI